MMMVMLTMMTMMSNNNNTILLVVNNNNNNKIDRDWLESNALHSRSAGSHVSISADFCDNSAFQCRSLTNSLTVSESPS